MYFERRYHLPVIVAEKMAKYADPISLSRQVQDEISILLFILSEGLKDFRES